MARLTSSPVSIHTPNSSHLLSAYGTNPSSSFGSSHRGSSSRPLAGSSGLTGDNTAIDSDNSSSASSVLPVASSYGSVLDDATILKNVSRHLSSDPNHSLQTQGGDITRDIYNLNSTSRSNALKRSKSLGGSDVLGERRESMASQIRVPGGFRRAFIQQKHTKFGHELNEPTALTRNFLEFLSIYGHFAGEDLEDEDYLACDYLSDDKYDEESPLFDGSRTPSPERGHERRQKKPAKGKASTIKSFFLLLKAFVGTGILFLPKAFSNGGLLLSVFLMIFFGGLSYYCYIALIQSKTRMGVSSFGEIGMLLYGRRMRVLIITSIVLSQLGFVSAYYVFTAENLSAFVKNVFNADIGIGTWILLEALFIIPMSLVRNLTKLSLAALIANVFILSGIATIVFYCCSDLIARGMATDIVMVNSSKWSLFIGVAIFAFEGIGLIIPVEEAMAKPEQFPIVLLAVIACCSILFIGIGALGYSTYGQEVKTVIILSLPQNSPFVMAIQLFYPLAIMFSTPLQLLPAIRIMETRIFKKRSGKTDVVTKWEKNTFRIFIVILTSLLAYYGSADLDLFVNFIGCFACIPLVYMYPPMLHCKTSGTSTPTKVLDISIVILGGVALCYTLYEIIQG